jgi:hypothetical protein
MNEHNAMTARCVLVVSDYRSFHRHVLFRYQKLHWLLGTILPIILLLSWLGARPEETTTEKIQTLIGATAVFAGVTVFLLLLRHFTGSRFRGSLGEHIFEISEAGITETNPNGKIETHLAGIRSVDETRHHFFVITQTGLGYVLPKRDLQSPEVVRSLQIAVRSRAEIHSSSVRPR